ncbi:hypothetical protein ACN6LF_005656 [[Kitasatospora] papulosa]|uniref:hypothetical protein n=1 Tax=[Kitasatospora] papulosa TaxID=1464011 RepID=UPI00403C066C
MNLYISAVNASLFRIACGVGAIVYRRTKTTQQSSVGPAASGDLVAAVTAAAATLLLLAFLFGVGDGSSIGAEPAPPKESAVSSAPPAR